MKIENYFLNDLQGIYFILTIIADFTLNFFSILTYFLLKNKLYISFYGS